MAESSTGRPVLTVSRDLSFDMRNRQGTKGERHADTDTGTSKDDGYGIYLNEDWDSGIGGGLWTTGLALAKYFIASPHFLQQFRLLQLKRRWNARDDNNRSMRVLELRSGNGFLRVCLVTAIVAAAANEDEESDSNSNCWLGIEVVVTDTAEHLNLMKTTIESNLKRIFPKILQDQQTRKKIQHGTKQRRMITMTTMMITMTENKTKDRLLLHVPHKPPLIWTLKKLPPSRNMYGAKATISAATRPPPPPLLT